jgi:ubiquinone/menaquinone biosynthesis C-methylase UbiE
VSGHGRKRSAQEKEVTAKSRSALHTKGLVVHWAGRYDLLLWFMTLGRERRFRERLLEPARLQIGESVLDVGCGTGSLALAAKRRVGSAGNVHGIDASPEMIARARHKASRQGAAITFDIGVAERLPFPDRQFDVVLSTVMLHHLPRSIRQQGVGEMRRVLKPGGRLLAIDFARSTDERKRLLARVHRHGGLRAGELTELATAAGLRVAESGPIGIWNLQYVRAEAPDA